MGTTKSRNPLGFTPLPVTIITVAVYVALFTGLIYTHHVVPSAPESSTPVKGINITEAWQDLQVLSGGYHPYNSRQNDEVRGWLLSRITDILEENKIRYETKAAASAIWKPSTWKTSTSPVTIYNDLTSNATYSSVAGPEAVYFEGTNIIVYIRGIADDETDWWQAKDSTVGGSRGVLVNAHYDSVSTGFGATDDGVGVVSVLQLIKYFTTSGNQPKRGVVALLDNGEEDYLQGARAFTQHPISKFPDTFLDLEGAGAGGRATLLRSTDAEVTKHYKKSPYPFGSVLSSDGFKRGLVRSQTNYVIYQDILRMRGLDVAFMEPRARYHTSEDSTTYTSKASLWHMLSAALATTKGLATDTTTDFRSNKGSSAVWFDLFGQAFGLITLHTMFALSITLLIVGPLVMILFAVVLSKIDKYWLFASSGTSNSLDPRFPDDDVVVHFKGNRGLFRYPIAFILASAAVVGLALLVNKLNPYIVYSSEYAVWSMMLCAWFVVAWFFLRGADFMRPSALHRAHSYGWLFVGSWAALVLTTVGENNFGVAGSYPLVIYFAAIFLALFISYLEFFALPTKTEVVRQVCNLDDDDASILTGGRPLSRASNRRYISDDEDAHASSERQEAASETTSLLSKKARRTQPKVRGRRRLDDTEDEDSGHIHGMKPAYGEEQEWSGSLPTWLWILQFLVTAPVMVILLGQIGLLLTSALHQTAADGSPALINYISIAVVSILMLVPISPFLHRFSSALPTLFFLVLIGTLVYNIMAFPFSENNRLKVYFIQQVEAETGINRVSLTGLDGYVQDIIASLPSAAGQNVKCIESPLANKKGLIECTWQGLAPNAVTSHNALSKTPAYANWLTINASQVNNNTSEAKLRVVGQNTRACKLLFDSPITSYDVQGAAAHDDRFPRMPRGGATELRLWHREWSQPWNVNVKWVASDSGNKSSPSRRGLGGKAVCLWSDANTPGVIPALDEVRHYMPAWSAVSKLSDGLVEVSTSFLI